MDMDAWEETMRVNLWAPLFASKCAIPVIRASGGGSIISTTSGAGNSGVLRPTAYIASKTALNFLTKAIATQHGVDNIRCNAVSPGYTVWDDPWSDLQNA
jgi:NAD(P)-dependent dehydrogenase (short-subunit alcohol dehydrogenase family)